MNPRVRLCLTLLILLPLAAALKADVTLAPLFCDHAVFQQGKPVPVWGKADPAEHVQVTFSGQSAGAVAGADGKWTVFLASLPASSAGADLVVAGKNTLRIHDVVVGEVWLCSGQSNMEFVVYDLHGTTFRVQNAQAEVAAAHFPLIRHFKVQKQTSGVPLDTVPGSWAVCSPETVPNFTAVGYFFARDLYRRLGVPVGIVNSSWGGTPIEAWMSAAALSSSPAFSVVGERWRSEVAAAPALAAQFQANFSAWSATDTAAASRGNAAHAAFLKANPRPVQPRAGMPQYEPAALFNGMINPLLPYALRGALWYQGEQNVSRPGEYHALLAAMITAWRSHFGQPDFPFYIVQLANFRPLDDPTGMRWAFLREAQAQALSLPATGMAVTIDIGNPDNIHPTNKQEVGRRLALIAKAQAYSIPEDYSGPVFSGIELQGPAIRVRFSFAGTGLTASGGPLHSFEVAGADRVFHPAAAAIEGDSVVVKSALVSKPVAVRYAWSNAPEANLHNGAGLPAAPFRSDSW